MSKYQTISASRNLTEKNKCTFRQISSSLNRIKPVSYLSGSERSFSPAPSGALVPPPGGFGADTSPTEFSQALCIPRVADPALVDLRD